MKTSVILKAWAKQDPSKSIFEHIWDFDGNPGGTCVCGPIPTSASSGTTHSQTFPMPSIGFQQSRTGKFVMLIVSFYGFFLHLELPLSQWRLLRIPWSYMKFVWQVNVSDSICYTTSSPFFEGCLCPRSIFCAWRRLDTGRSWPCVI